jgi:hypothetical protein
MRVNPLKAHQGLHREQPADLNGATEIRQDLSDVIAGNPENSESEPEHPLSTVYWALKSALLLHVDGVPGQRGQGARAHECRADSKARGSVPSQGELPRTISRPAGARRDALYRVGPTNGLVIRVVWTQPLRGEISTGILKAALEDRRGHQTIVLSDHRVQFVTALFDGVDGIRVAGDAALFR